MPRAMPLVLLVVMSAPLPAQVFDRPSWSPDGTQIAFHSDANGNLDVYLYRIEDGSVSRITDHPGADGWPAWPPDGTRISFSSDRHGNADLYLMAVDGRLLDRLTDDDRHNRSHAWAEDGRRLAFESLSAAGDGDLLLLDLIGGQARSLLARAEDDRAPALCAGRVLFESGRGAARRIDALMGVGQRPESLVEHPAGEPHCGGSGDRAAVVHVRAVDGETDIWWMRPDGSEARPLTGPGDGDDHAPALSPDGRWVVFQASRAGALSLYVVAADGGAAVPLTAFRRSERARP